MTLSELKKLAQSATPGPWIVGYNDGSGRGYSVDGSFDSIYVTQNGENAVATMFNGSHADAQLIAAMNPSTALRMIELLEEASGFIRALNIVPPTKECERMTAKWLKDLEEL